MPTSIAPLISGWQRRVGGQPGPYAVAPASGVASGGTGANGLLVELLVDGSWVDITQRVMVRDSGGQIRITRGQTAEGQAPSPGTCELQLNNRDGLFSPLNPLSPYYGKIGRNTQLRVSVTKGDDKSYRFWGEVPAWPEDWDITDTDVWVDITAAGILQRLNQGSTPLRSTMYRGIMSAATPTPVAYWPMEDGSASTSLASALGGPAMTIGGAPSLSSDTGFYSSAALPVLNGGAFSGVIPPYTVTGQSQFSFLMYLPTGPADNTVLVQAQATGTIPRWALVFNTGGALALKGLDTDGTVLVTSGPVAYNITGHRCWAMVSLTQNGSNVDWEFGAVNTPSGAGFTTGTFTSQTVGRLTSVTVSPAGAMTDAVFGHVSVQPAVTDLLALAGQVRAFVSETATARISRLCAEEGINYTNFTIESSDAMGPQLPNTFMALLQECADVDQGILLERETAFGLAYKARALLYNQNAQLTLSYPGHQLAEVPRPVPDAKLVQNSVTASRPNGSSATYVQETGTLSVQPPPLGVGTYPDAPSLNVQYDNDLPQHAAWRVHLGTVDEPRYPAISVNLAHPAMATKRLGALNVLFGNRIVVTNPPSRLGGDISQIVIGIQETIDHFQHRITYICQPESPYRVATLDDPTYGRLDTDGSVLAADLTPTQTSMQVAVTAGPTWTTDPSDAPFDVTVAGEQIRVDAVGATIINQNPYLDTDLTGWQSQNSSITAVTSPLYDSALHSMLIVPDGVSASGGATASSITDPGTITAGTSYIACLWAYSPGGWSDLRPAVDWYDASGTFLSSGLGSGTSVPAGAWTFITQTLTAPASASRVSMRARHGGTPPSSAVWYAWGIRLLTVAAAAASPQTMAVTRARNSIVKAHASGEDVRLTHPLILAL